MLTADKAYVTKGVAVVPTRIEFPSIGIQVEHRAVLLAIDDAVLQLKKNLCYYLSKPQVRQEPVLRPSRDDPAAPDHIGTHFYGTVLLDGDKYRMWYYPVSLGDKPGELNQGPVCYAESDDGIQWTKPSLGQVEFKGSRNNNAIALPDDRIEGVTLIKDDDDPDPQRRYKMVYNYWHAAGPFFTIRTATSADGIHWTAGPELPLDEFAEQASFYKFNGLYIVNGQSGSTHWSEGGSKRGRHGFAWISTDFDHWLAEAAESFTLPEPADRAARGIDKPYDQVHLGIGAVSHGNGLVGLYCIWHNQDLADHWFGFGKISGDFGLVVSSDGLYFREPVKGHVYLSVEESPVTPAAGKSYPTILCQANGILNVGDETRIYHGRWRNARYDEDYYAEVALATLPRDRWGALGLFPDKDEGAVWTAPIILPEGGCTITLNADVADGIRVEVADEHFNPLPDFSGAASGHTSQASGLECPVVWPTGDLASLNGQRVRFRVHLKRTAQDEPRLYALYLQTS